MSFEAVLDPTRAYNFHGYPLVAIARCPASRGYILNLSWWVYQNVDLGVQYTGYTSFNGAGTNYDGVGRNASDNNSVYLLGRFVF